jgi:hypothetical protein
VVSLLLIAFFQVEEVTDIIMKMRDELKKALANEVATKKPNVLTLAASMKAFETSKHGQPALFNDVCIFGKGCIPGVKASF